MHLGAIRHAGRCLLRGLAMRCPHCEYGRLFRNGFAMRATCAYCGVRFARARGEMIGAMYLNSVVTLVLALAGFFVSELRFGPPLGVQLVLWTTFSLVFALAFFRAAHGLWIAIAYLTGGVYADPDYEREWTNPAAHTVADRQP